MCLTSTTTATTTTATTTTTTATTTTTTTTTLPLLLLPLLLLLLLLLVPQLQPPVTVWCVGVFNQDVGVTFSNTNDTTYMISPEFRTQYFYAFTDNGDGTSTLKLSDIFVKKLGTFAMLYVVS